MLENYIIKSNKFNKCSLIISGFLLLLCSILISCSTKPVRQDLSVQGEWEARVLVRDKKNSKTYLVNVDFYAIKNTKLRMDVTTTLGMHVASFALNDKNASYVIPDKKIYYSGPSGTNIFKSVMNLNMDPKLLIHILFDIPIKGGNWSCINDANGFLASCERSTDKFKVLWSNRKSKEKTVLVVHNEYELEMKFHSYNEKKEIKPEVFEIKQPEGFRKI